MAAVLWSNNLSKVPRNRGSGHRQAMLWPSYPLGLNPGAAVSRWIRVRMSRPEAGQQHYRECNFAGDEGLAQALAASSG